MRSIRSNQTKMNLSRMVAHKGQCNKKWFAANKKDRMQTKKVGCKQKTKTCHDVNKKGSPNQKENGIMSKGQEQIRGWLYFV